MAGAEPGTIISVEVLVKEDVIAPMGIVLELLSAAIDRSMAILVPQEDAGETIGDLLAHVEKIHQVAGARGTFDFEVVAVIEVEV